METGRIDIVATEVVDNEAVEAQKHVRCEAGGKPSSLSNNDD